MGVVICVLMLASSLFAGVAAADEPSEIGNWTELQDMELDGDYVLVADLNEGTEDYNDVVGGGDGFEPIGEADDEFEGTFDGNGHTISNLTIDRTGHVGLFGVSGEAALIQNLTLVDLDVTSDDNKDDGIGGLVGNNSGDIVNVSVAGTVTHGGNNVGGIVGINHGLIHESASTVTVSGDGNVGVIVGDHDDGTISQSFAAGDATGSPTDWNVGGLAGQTRTGSTVKDSYATSTVENDNNRVGGLVGYLNGGEIKRSYSTGDVTGDDEVGGLVGYNNDGDVHDSYWDTDATGVTASDGGEGLSTFEMTSLVAKDYMDFDYDETWNATGLYPRLAWESVDEPDPYPAATPGESEVWLLNDSTNGYYHNYSLDGGDVRWLGDVVASVGDDDTGQLIEIAAGNATADYDTIVVGEGDYNLMNHEVDLTADGAGNLARLFAYEGSEQTNLTRSGNFEADDEALLRVDSPDATDLSIGDAGPFETNGDGGFYLESDNLDSEESPLIGVYNAADQFNLTVTNSTFGMATDIGDTILLRDGGTAFDLELDVRSHSGTLINVVEASTLAIHNSTITEENDPRGNGLLREGISFLTLDAGGLDDVAITNVAVDGATESDEVDGVVDILDLDTDASVSIDGLHLTDTDEQGLNIETDVDTVTVVDSEFTNTARELRFNSPAGSISTNEAVSQFNVTNTSITDGGTNGLYLRGTIGNATIDNNSITNMGGAAIDIDLDVEPSTPFEISNNDITESGTYHIHIVSDTRANITDNRLFDSVRSGIHLNGADSVIDTNRIENITGGSNFYGIELERDASNSSIIDTIVTNTTDTGIYVAASNVTVRNATVDTTGVNDVADTDQNGFRFTASADNSELIGSTVRNNSGHALVVGSIGPSSATVAVTDSDLGSGTISADVTDNSLNTTFSQGLNNYQSSDGDNALRIQSAGDDVENLTLSYNASEITIDERALEIFRVDNTGWSTVDSIVNTDEQVLVATEPISGPKTVQTFASNVSINANDTTVEEGEAGTIDLDATNGETGLENVELNITDDDGLDGIEVGDSVTTDANGEANVSFQESTEGTYRVWFRWNNRVSAFATVTVEPNGGDGGNNNNGDNGGGTPGGNTGGGGGSGPATPPAVEQTTTDDGAAEVSGGQSGDTISINDETLRRTSSLDGLDNIAVDGLSVELATDRDFFINVETYERGQEDEVDATNGASSSTEADEPDNSTRSSIAATFENETETVSVGYVTVSHNLEPEDISNVSFDFSVSQSYLDSLDVEPENVSLYRQEDDWSTLSTEYRELSQSRYRFDGDSPGFSSFAIGTNAPLSIVVNGTLDQTEITEGDTATATASVTNRGENAVTHTVNLTASGEMVATETVTVDGGETVEISLAFDPAAGSYEMVVDDVDIGSLTVIEPATSPLWLLVVLLAVLIIGVVVWRRRNDEDENGTQAETDTGDSEMSSPTTAR